MVHLAKLWSIWQNYGPSGKMMVHLANLRTYLILDSLHSQEECIQQDPPFCTRGVPCAVYLTRNSSYLPRWACVWGSARAASSAARSTQSLRKEFSWPLLRKHPTLVISTVKNWEFLMIAKRIGVETVTSQLLGAKSREEDANIESVKSAQKCLSESFLIWSVNFWKKVVCRPVFRLPYLFTSFNYK